MDLSDNHTDNQNMFFLSNLFVATFKVVYNFVLFDVANYNKIIKLLLKLIVYRNI